MTGLFNSCISVNFTSCFLYSALNPSLIASFDMQKMIAHHSVLRAIIRWFLDRSDNGEWCTLSTYTIGLKFTILSQDFIARNAFLGHTMIWKELCGITF